MTAPAKLSTAQFQRNIFLFGIINFAVYAAILLISRFFHMRTWPSLLVLVDCLVLWLISHIQIKTLVKKYGAVMKFLRSFSLVFFTGVWAFVLFGVFIIVIFLLDKEFADQLTGTGEQMLTPIIVIISEGAGGSIIVALICMMYADRFYDHEIKP